MKALSSIRCSRCVPWFILAVGLMLVAMATVQLKIRADRDDKSAFNIRCNAIKLKIIERLYDHARILRSGAAFLSVDEAVTRDKWHRYTELQETKNKLPGIQGLGFSLLIQPAERTRHIQEIRSEGFPEYTVKPAGDRELYSAIIYLEPFDARNQRAFGYDMFSEPVRRAAMERSRDEDMAILSGKVLLVQETDEDVQAGTLMYVPVYRKGMPTASVEQRRTALYGWVYSPYRMTDLIRGILGDLIVDQEQSHRYQIQIFDGELPLPQTLLYQLRSVANGTRDLKEQNTELLPVDFNGHRWTLRFIQTRGGLFSALYMKVWVVFIGGTLVTFIIFGLIWTLLSTGEKQYRLAQELAINLRDERQRMARIIHATDVGTWEWDVQTGEVLFNDKWAQMIGYTLNELAPVTIKTWKTLSHPDDLKRSDEILNKHFSGKQPFYECECRIKHKDGSWVWVCYRGQLMTRTSDGLPLMMFGTSADVTERKQAEEQIARLLEESNQAKKALLGIIEDDAKSRAALLESEKILSEAQSIARMGSYALDIPSGRWKSSVVLDEVLGIGKSYNHTREGWVALMHPADRAMMSDYLKDGIIRERKPFNMEYRIIRQNDQVERWVHGIGRLKLDETDATVKMVGTIQDITKRKQDEAELQKLANLQSVGLLAGGIAHDFNNILQGLYGNISLAMEDLAKAHPSYALLEDAEKSMKRAVRLTKQLLTFAKGGDPVKESVSLGVMIEEVTRFTLTGSNVRIVCRQAEDLWTVDADRGQIQQVVSNLVINARQAMPKGGHLTITLENADIPADAVPTLKQGRYVKIVVQDEGTGIDPTVLGHIFDPYFTTKQTGSGLGLATVWSIITRHGGHIGVASEVSKGTAFTLYLPTSSSRLSAEEEPPAAEVPAPARPAKILVMDDDETVCGLVAEMLTRCGYSVATALDGQETVALYRWALEAGAPFDAVELLEEIASHIGEALMRKRAERELCRSAADLHALAARLLGVREEERAALSRELHDTLGQHLTAFALQFESVCMESHALANESSGLAALHGKITDMEPLVERLIEKTQSICAALRPGVLDELGLAAAIEWLAEKTAKQTGIVIMASLPEEDVRLDRDIALALFRIAQEALTNVARHAQATRAEVGLHASGNGWELEIQDNGQGFVPVSRAGPKALGLLGMRERAAVFGGTVDFLSEPGKGTTVRVRIPGCTTRAENGEVVCV